MRNELNRLVQTTSDPNTKRVCPVPSHMVASHRPRGQGVRHGDAVILLPLYALSHREGQEPRAVCNPTPLIQDDYDRPNTWAREWDHIKSPAADQIVPYDKLPKATGPDALNKLAVLKVNGGLGTSMGMGRLRSYIQLLTHYIVRYDRGEVCARGQGRHDLPRSDCAPDRTFKHDA